jgi:hypothetical protein
MAIPMRDCILGIGLKNPHDHVFNDFEITDRNLDDQFSPLSRPLHPDPLIATEANAVHLSSSCSCRPCRLGGIRETDQVKQVLN